MTKFFDTSSLLLLGEKAFEDKFVISYITLHELESIKTSANKEQDIKYKARKLIKLLDQNSDKFETFICGKDIAIKYGLEPTNDNIIVAGASLYNEDKPIEFISDDICLKTIAKNVLKLNVKSASDILNNDSEYKGYKEVKLKDNEMAYFYENLNVNQFHCLNNEYLIVKNSHGDIVDKKKWNGEKYVDIIVKPFKSKCMDIVKPNDEIQALAFDSIINNEITLLYGRAGSGKTTIPFAYFMQNIENQKIKKLNIIYHYEPLKGAKTLGFEKGDHEQKLLNTGSIAGILDSKVKEFAYIKSLLGLSIEIIPTANIRGIEFGSDEAVFVTECQNINPYTLKTIVQRCKSGCRQIYEGDMLEQSDISMPISGMQRMIEVFRDNDKFGCVKLRNDYRSKLCELADKM